MLLYYNYFSTLLLSYKIAIIIFLGQYNLADIIMKNMLSTILK